jgi:hypothetical protein
MTTAQKGGRHILGVALTECGVRFCSRHVSVRQSDPCPASPAIRRSVRSSRSFTTPTLKPPQSGCLACST